MADDSSATAATSESPTVVDNALHAAEGTRTASRWLASALGAIPSLAVLGAIVRSPGDAGFNVWLLTAGVGLCAAGALIGVLAFAWVITPVPLEDETVRKKIPLTRLPGVLISDWADFDTQLTGARTGLIDAEQRLDAGSEDAARSKSEAQGLVGIADEAEARVKESPDDEALKRRASEARRKASRKQRDAVAAEARLAASQVRLESWKRAVSRRLAIREQAYLLAASDEVRARYSTAQKTAGFAVVLIAAGVVCLGLAPNPKPAPDASVSLVRLTLNDAGKAALGCRANTVQALRTGGTDTAPTVITWPQEGCPSRTLTFTTATPAVLGTVSTPKP